MFFLTRQHPVGTFPHRLRRAAVIAGAVALAAIGAGYALLRRDASPPLPNHVASVPTPDLTAAQVRDVLAAAVQDAPDDPMARLELALFYRRTGDPANAERELLAGCEKFPGFARAFYHLGMLYLFQERNAEATAPLERAAALSPNDPQVQMNAGLACFRAGKEKAAKRYAEATLRLNPRQPDVYLLLARMNDRHGTAKKALSYLRQYLEYSPRPAPGYYLMGRIHARLGERDEAERWLRRAVEADPNTPDFWTTLGRVYFEMSGTDRAEEGIRCYEKALAIAPDHADAHRYLGLARMKQRRFQEAATHLRTALRGVAEPGPLYYDLGQALLNAGRTDEGRQALATHQAYRDFTTGFKQRSRAVDEAPKDRTRRYELARFCLKYRQYRASLDVLRETAQKLGPDETLRRLVAEVQAGHAAAAAGAPEQSRREGGSDGR